jgi:hypothetical protein
MYRTVPVCTVYIPMVLGLFRTLTGLSVRVGFSKPPEEKKYTAVCTSDGAHTPFCFLYPCRSF